MKSRILSGAIALAYLVAALAMADGRTTLMVAIFLLLPLACIWFGDEIGGFTGMGGGSGPVITRTTPGCFVALGGWLLLLLPVLIWVIGTLGAR